MWRLAGDVALARGDLRTAADAVASTRAVTDDSRYDAQYHLPLIRLDTELRLAQQRPADAMSVAEDALDRPRPAAEPPLRLAGAGGRRPGGGTRRRPGGRADREVGGAARAAPGRGWPAARGRAGAAGSPARPSPQRRNPPGDVGATRQCGRGLDTAARAWQVRQRAYSLAAALLRAAEAALSRRRP